MMHRLPWFLLCFALVPSIQCKDIPTSILLRIEAESGLSPPEVLVLDVYTADGVSVSDQLLPPCKDDPSPCTGLVDLPDQVVLYPKEQQGEVRILVRAHSSGSVAGEGTTRVTVEAGKQVSATVVIQSGRLPDTDGDDVPDDIDNCPAVPNPDQEPCSPADAGVDLVSDGTLPDIPVTDIPATDIPVTDIPATDIPATDTPVTDIPATDIPVADIPVMDLPLPDSPVSDASAQDTLMSDSAQPDLLLPDSSAPDTAVPDLPVPDLPLPDLLVPDLPVPDTVPACPVTCLLGCQTGTSTCNSLVPSNSFSVQVYSTIPVANTNRSIDTTLCQLTLGQWGVLVNGNIQTGAGGVQACVFGIESLTIESWVTVTVTGDYPLALLVKDTVTLDGVLDLGAHGASPGPGGAKGGEFQNTPGADGEGQGGGQVCGCGATAADDCGGGGGGFGSPGAEGGDEDGGCSTSALGGVSYGNDSMIPLLGGSGGASGGQGTGTTPVPGTGGAGGGALQISCGGTVSINGSISVGGGGGLVGETRRGWRVPHRLQRPQHGRRGRWCRGGSGCGGGHQRRHLRSWRGRRVRDHAPHRRRSRRRRWRRRRRRGGPDPLQLVQPRKHRAGHRQRADQPRRGADPVTPPVAPRRVAMGGAPCYVIPPLAGPRWARGAGKYTRLVP
jgi:hypothetical protein